MDMKAAGLFTLTVTALLGSPGPGIAALLAVGRVQGFRKGLRFFAGLQVGLAAALVSSALGLLSLLAAYSTLGRVLALCSAAYLVYLAYSIAASPIGRDAPANRGSYTPLAGALLGITNPKAYLAFATLLAMPLRLSMADKTNVVLKVAVCLAVIFVVDLFWLWVGVAVGRMQLSARAERLMNLGMGATILSATAFAML